jgi:hypothetical protein
VADIVQKCLIVLAVLIAALMLGFGAYRFGHTEQPKAQPAPARWLMFNTEDGTFEQTTDEQRMNGWLKNRRLRVFSLDTEQYVEVLSPTRAPKRFARH